MLNEGSEMNLCCSTLSLKEGQSERMKVNGGNDQQQRQQQDE
jgi:hypothetical protein